MVDGITNVGAKLSDATLQQNMTYSASSNEPLLNFAKNDGDDPRTAALKKAGIPEDVIKQGDEAVKAYAKKHGIKLQPPPQSPPQSLSRLS